MTAFHFANPIALFLLLAAPLLFFLFLLWTRLVVFCRST